MAFVECAHGRHKAETLALVAQGTGGRVHVMNCFADFHRVKIGSNCGSQFMSGGIKPSYARHGRAGAPVPTRAVPTRAVPTRAVHTRAILIGAGYRRVALLRTGTWS